MSDLPELAPERTELLANFASLAADRGWDTDTMAAHLDRTDKALAADYRARYTKTRTAAPKGRASRASDTAAAAPDAAPDSE